jgi:hypothetical protein
MKNYQIKSIALMHHKSARAVELATNGDLEAARELIDELRFLRAVFTTKLELQKDSHSDVHDETDGSKSLAVQVGELNENLETIFQWINKIQQEFSFEELIKSNEGINIYLDSQIPAIWNWLEDVIILPNDHEGQFSGSLEARGQKKIIILNSGQSGRNTRYIESTDDASPALADWVDDPVGRQIFITTSPRATRDEALLKEIQEIFLGFITRDNTKRKFSRRWALQQVTNLAKIISNKNILDLAPLLAGKKCIIVSPGPSLKKNIALLKDQTTTQQHVIIAAVQACPALLENNITPDFVMVIDPQDLSNGLDGTDCSKISGLIIGDTCHPSFYDKPFQNIFSYFSFRPALNTAEIMATEQITLFGGSVTVAAAFLAAKLGAHEISLIGSDLSFETERYSGAYTNKHDDPLIFSDEVVQNQISVPGYFGGDVKTLPNYLMFKRELEELAGVWGDAVRLNNCTEGGAYIEGFSHTPLSEVLADTVGEPKDLYVPKNSQNEISTRLKKLLKALNQERANLNKAKTLAAECLQLAEKVRAPGDQKLPTLNKKEKKLSLLVANSESLDILCDTEVSAIQRKIGRVNSFDGNIVLSKTMYLVIVEAIEVLRAAISAQIASIQTSSR